MGSHFYGAESSCHTSNGGAELFFRSVVAVASPTTRVDRETVAFLTDRIMPERGFRDFDLRHDLPTVGHLRALARFVETLACRLASGILSTTLNPDFGREDRVFQLRWAAWTADFYELIRQADSGVPQLILPRISLEETMLLDLHRLDNQLIHLVKCVPESQQAQLGVVAQQLERAKKLEDARLQILSLERMAALFVDLGEVARGAQAYREAAALASEPDEKKELLELAALAEAINE